MKARIAILTLILAATAAWAQSNARKEFDQIRALQGEWVGKTQQGMDVSVGFRETAGGSAILSEIHGHGPENMVSMIHMDNDRLMMTHYCGAGNQPRMVASPSPDGKSITFTFIDATNLASPKTGHMEKVIFTMPDADHHIEEWTFVQDGKVTKEIFELHRKV